MLSNITILKVLCVSGKCQVPMSYTFDGRNCLGLAFEVLGMSYSLAGVQSWELSVRHTRSQKMRPSASGLIKTLYEPAFDATRIGCRVCCRKSVGGHHLRINQGTSVLLGFLEDFLEVLVKVRSYGKSRITNILHARLSIARQPSMTAGYVTNGKPDCDFLESISFLSHYSAECPELRIVATV